MTFWATLWYAGAVVVTMGHEGQTLSECRVLTRVMMHDVQVAYENQETMNNLATSMFPTNQFTATCETERLPIDEEYLQ